NVLRASSLAAVMIFVWSTRLSPASTAQTRVNWRTRTTSSDDRMARRSVLVVGIDVLQGRPTLDQLHAALNIESGPHSRQRQTQFNQRDCNRGAHADDDRLRIENSRNGSDAIEHAADEAVDDLQRGNVDQDALGPQRHDFARQILFERGRKA